MSLPGRLEAALAGWPGEGLALALVLVAVALVLTALFAPALVRAAVLAWIVLP